MTLCILCSEPLDRAEVVGTKARGGKDSRRVACSRCGLVQVDPAPAAEVLDAYYASGDYWQDHPPPQLRLTLSDGREGWVAPDDPRYSDTVDLMHRERAATVVKTLGLEPGSRVLELGCGYGKTLLQLEALGMECTGIEPGVDARDEADTKGVQYGFTLGEAVNAGLHGYDALCAFHVLEHFPDPLAALGHMRKLLKPGGRIFLEVPNVMQPSVPLTEHWQWVHLYDFSGDTLMALLLRAGFEDVQVDEHTPQLRAWAVSGARQATSYEVWDDEGAPKGPDVAAALRMAEQRLMDAPQPSNVIEALEDAIADRLYDDVGDLELILALTKRGYAGIARLAKSYHDATNLIGHYSQHYEGESFRHFEGWQSDTFLYGLQIGKAQAYHEIKELLAYVGNAMRQVELKDKEREGGQ